MKYCCKVMQIQSLHCVIMISSSIKIQCVYFLKKIIFISVFNNFNFWQPGDAKTKPIYQKISKLDITITHTVGPTGANTNQMLNFIDQGSPRFPDKFHT